MIKYFNFILKKKPTNQIVFYLLIFFIIIFFSYFFTPKFFNYSPQLIEENFKTINKINIKNISKISYHIFPTPRLKVTGSTLKLKEDILKIDGSEIEIILKLSSILNYKSFNYDKIIIKGGSTKININSINQLLNYFKKNKLKIYLIKNNLILKKNNKFLFEINNSTTKISSEDNQQQININGLFLNHKTIFSFERKPSIGSNIIIKIPKLDILCKISLGKKNNLNFFNGKVDFEVLNNFFQFNFRKEKKIKINKGFIRNNLINSSLKGTVEIKPNFFLDLIFEPTILNMKKLFPIIQKKYFSNDAENLELIKKINGFFTFKKMFQGDVIFNNGEILFQNFKTGVNNSLLVDARISKFGKKGKIYFNILKIINHKKKPLKELKVSGFVIPSTSRIVFEKISLDNEAYTQKEIISFEKKFKKEVTQKSLSSIFDETKMNNFFNNF